MGVAAAVGGVHCRHAVPAQIPGEHRAACRLDAAGRRAVRWRRWGIPAGRSNIRQRARRQLTAYLRWQGASTPSVDRHSQAGSRAGVLASPSFVSPAGKAASRNNDVLSMAAQGPHHIPVAPNWTRARPFLGLSHLFEPRGSARARVREAREGGWRERDADRVCMWARARRPRAQLRCASLLGVLPRRAESLD